MGFDSTPCLRLGCGIGGCCSSDCLCFVLCACEMTGHEGCYWGWQRGYIYPYLDSMSHLRERLNALGKIVLSRVVTVEHSRIVVYKLLRHNTPCDAPWRIITHLVTEGCICGYEAFLSGFGPLVAIIGEMGTKNLC